MSYEFRPAIREEVALLIGLIGASGSGKTYSAMRLASGIVGKDKRFAVIDTEARRSLHYADMFNFDFTELKPPFRPSIYAEAIKAADDAGYKVIVVDSISHEWAGESGILDWQEEELTRMAGDDYRKRESCKMAAWIKPKIGHKQMVQKLLQIKANIILCFRAEEKIGMEKENGKTVIVPKGWQPICEKSLPYELTVSFLLTPDKPGYPQPIKLQEQHKAIFPLDKPINEESGLRVSEWATGGIVPEPPPKTSNKPPFDSTIATIYDSGDLDAETFAGILHDYKVKWNNEKRMIEETSSKKITRKEQISLYETLQAAVKVSKEGKAERNKEYKEYYAAMAGFKETFGEPKYRFELKKLNMKTAADAKTSKDRKTVIDTFLSLDDAGGE